MGENKRWWEHLASWFRALPKGKKWAAGFGMFVAAYLIVVPLSNLIIVSVLYPESDYVTVQCGERSTESHKDDPIWDKPDPEGAQEMCNRAWAGVDR